MKKQSKKFKDLEWQNSLYNTMPGYVTGCIIFKIMNTSSQFFEL